MSRLLWTLVAALSLLPACGADDGDTIDAAPTATLAPPSPDDGADQPSPTPADAATATATPEATVPAGPTDFIDVGVPEIALTLADPGPKPALSWTAADGADRYYVAVWSADGRPYWSWWGTDTSVVVGGGSGATSGQTPVLEAPLTARVYAFDVADSMVGVSQALAIG